MAEGAEHREGSMKRLFVVAACLLLLIYVSACGPSEAGLAETEAVIQSTSHAKETNTAGVERTSVAGTQNAEVTQAAEAAETEQAAQAATATWSFEVTQTAEEAARQAKATNTSIAATQQTMATATAEAERIYEVVKTLYDKGYISTADGYYQKLPDFSDNLTGEYFFDFIPIPDSYAEDFVLVLDMSWEIEDPATIWRSAGCGITFRMNDEWTDYYAYFLTLEEQINFGQVRAGRLQKYTSPWDDIDHMKDSATFIFIAEGSKIKAFNGNLELKDQRDAAALAEGSFAFMFVAGSYVEPGTQCEFTNVDLWHIEN